MMMISITLALGAILVAWAGGAFGAFTSGSQLFFAQRGQALQERFVVENVFFNKGSNLVRVFVRNVGVVEVNVVAIYVNGTSFTDTSMGVVSPCTLSLQGNVNVVTMPVEAVCEFQLSWTLWTTGAIYHIVIASTRGNQAAFASRGP